jgi:hypothetical protein
VPTKANEKEKRRKRTNKISTSSLKLYKEK